VKIAISATQPSLDAAVDQRFGRCACFAVVDPESMETQFLDNPNIGLGSGAGIQTARLLADHQVSLVLTGNCGPNAWQTLEAAGIAVVLGCAGGTVRQAVDRYSAGELQTAASPNVAGAAHKPKPGLAQGPGMGRGMGRGGRGGGRGRGGGGGMGGGLGQGPGRGQRRQG
jgi:predicted Fe-Mo cluster-binding NifX family protein